MTTGLNESCGGISAEEALELLREESSLYDRLVATTVKQKTLVTGADLSPLLALLADRQKLSTALTRIGGRLAPIRNDWANRRKGFTPSQQAEADRLINDIRSRLRQIIDSDEQDARTLCARKQVVAQTLRSTHSAGEALAAYRTPSSREARVDASDGVMS